MFVNSVSFLVSALRNINLIKIEHAPKRTASKLCHLLQCIVNIYARAGFHLRTILMDNEFEKICDHVSTIDMSTSAAAEHTVEIDWCIRMIKERCHGILCTLPYKALQQQILIHLLHFVVMWLNNFQLVTGILSTFSPCKLILQNCLDYNNTAVHHLGLTVRHTKKIHLLTQCHPAAFLQFA
jgi:hypothetical protein